MKMAGNWRTFLSLLVAGALFAAACDKKDDAKANPSANSGTAGGPVAEGPGGPAPSLSALPESLKHDGYVYYGLGNAGAIEYQVISTNATEPKAGTATTVLSKLEDGKAVFTTTRTGALSDLGEEEIELRPEGVFNTKIGGQAVEPAQLVMPSELPVGHTWSTKGKITVQGGQVFEQDIRYKVIGNEKVKTKAGEFDALKVTASGEIKLNGEASKSDVSAWYVKDVGTVKMTISTTGPRKVTMTIEATKVP